MGPALGFEYGRQLLVGVGCHHGGKGVELGVHFTCLVTKSGHLGADQPALLGVGEGGGGGGGGGGVDLYEGLVGVRDGRWGRWGR